MLPGSDDVPRWPSIDQLCEQWSDEHLASYSKSEQYLFRTALTRLRLLYGGYPTNEFGRSKLKEVRKLFVAAGNCVRTTNGQMRRLRTSFPWGGMKTTRSGCQMTFITRTMRAGSVCKKRENLHTLAGTHLKIV